LIVDHVLCTPSPSFYGVHVSARMRASIHMHRNKKSPVTSSGGIMIQLRGEESVHSNMIIRLPVQRVNKKQG